MTKAVTRTTTRPPAAEKHEMPAASASPLPNAPALASAERPVQPLSAFLAQLENVAIENHKLVERLLERLAPVSLPPGALGEPALGKTEAQMSEFAIRLEAQVKGLTDTNRLLEDAARRLQL